MTTSLLPLFAGLNPNYPLTKKVKQNPFEQHVYYPESFMVWSDILDDEVELNIVVEIGEDEYDHNGNTITHYGGIDIISLGVDEVLFKIKGLEDELTKLAHLHVQDNLFEITDTGNWWGNEYED